MINLSKLFNRSGDPYANLDRHSLWLKFKLAGALTNNRMLPQRQWLLGGTVGVRGYPEAIVAGDRGFLFSMEYRWKLFSLGSSPKKRFSLSVAPFFDYGQSFIKDPFFYESDQTLIGLGCGLLSELPGGGRARLDFAKPLTESCNRNRYSGGHPRVMIIESMHPPNGLFKNEKIFCKFCPFFSPHYLRVFLARGYNSCSGRAVMPKLSRFRNDNHCTGQQYF